MSRPQVSIDRLPARRPGNEVRESMNCKSCRKRKIKCSRTRPSCESCTLFQCPCIYDAVPKKRGPKTDVLEALMKRVDGLEKRLQEEQHKPTDASTSQSEDQDSPSSGVKRKSEHLEIPSPHALSSTKGTSPKESSAKRPATHDTAMLADPGDFSTGLTNLKHPRTSSINDNLGSTPPPANQFVVIPDSVLDTFFVRVNEKPFYLLDEQSVRQQHRTDQIPPALSLAIYALTMRHTSWPNASISSLRRLSQNYAAKSRQLVDSDIPTLENLQTLLLLSLASLANGQGRKSYLIFGSCITMAFALELHREVSPQTRMLLSERDTRRRIFWTCYILDRFFACGSKRPSLISDTSIALRLPSWLPTTGGLMVDGDLFHAGPNLRYCSDPRRRGQDAVSLLIDIARILGIANQYSAAGGVKGDSHFPWHSHSSISKIRSELDIWASSTQDVFGSIEALFGHPQASVLLLSKLIYHLAHCIIYRPFLPMDLVELRGTGQHQSWQIEATSLCFSHANAIIELVEIGRASPMVEWTAFVGHCVWTAGTVHIHGAHYKGREGDVFSASADYLMRGISQLSWLSNMWSCIQHHREMLRNVHAAHSQLVNALSSNPMSTPVAVFHLEGFFERYTGQEFDGSHVKLTDLPIEEFVDGLAPFSRNAQGLNFGRTRDASVSSISPHTQHALYTSSVSGALKANQPSSSYSPLQNTGMQTQPLAMYQMPQTLQSLSEQQPIKMTLSNAQPASTLHDQPNTTTADIAAGYSQFAFPNATNYVFSPPQPLTQPVGELAEPQYATFPFEPRHQPHLDPSHPFDPFSRPVGQHVAVESSVRVPSATIPIEHQQNGPTDQSAVSEKDPFLSLLEQLVDEQNTIGGPNELDYFLAGEADTGSEQPGRNGADKGTRADQKLPNADVSAKTV